MLTFEGKYFSFKEIPMELEPLQKPYPPMWYGVHSVDSAERAAKQGLNMVSLDSAQDTLSYNDRYRQVWRELHGDQPTPKLGLSRFIVIAENGSEALSAARRAYPIWHRHFYYLYSIRGGKPTHPRPDTFDKMAEIGQAIAGDPDAVTKFLEAQIDESTANYLVGQFAFGDLTLKESLRSVHLFHEHVMPKLNRPS
jgi:alkanesulfonate monooxygenase SsuD/methylene tetrahydromethanopterin reductase-like flavin-dependent oxidoreductase (luciferase family)